MANTKAAKKALKQSQKRRVRNVARHSSIKTAVKKVYTALENKQAKKEIDSLLRDAVSQLARAKGKDILHKNTVDRKISRMTKCVNKHFADSATKTA